MAKYRKKPVVFEAVQIIEGNDEAIMAFMEKTKCPFEVTAAYTMVIHTIHGDMTVNSGDWIIQEVANEFFPCTAHTFATMYEPTI